MLASLSSNDKESMVAGIRDCGLAFDGRVGQSLEQLGECTGEAGSLISSSRWYDGLNELFGLRPHLGFCPRSSDKRGRCPSLSVRTRVRIARSQSHYSYDILTFFSLPYIFQIHESEGSMTWISRFTRIITTRMNRDATFNALAKDPRQSDMNVRMTVRKLVNDLCDFYESMSVPAVSDETTSLAIPRRIRSLTAWSEMSSISAISMRFVSRGIAK